MFLTRSESCKILRGAVKGVINLLEFKLILGSNFGGVVNDTGNLFLNFGELGVGKWRGVRCGSGRGGGGGALVEF